MSLGTNSKAAISKIVETLAHLKLEGNAAPTALHADLAAIRTAAASKAGGARDVQFDAAQEWAERLLVDASAADNEKPAKKEKPEPEPEEEPKQGHAHKKEGK